MKMNLAARMVVLSLLAPVLFSQHVGAATSWTCNGVPATIVGTPGDDVLVGTSGPDVIVGREGNDKLVGLGGDDILCGGKGNDELGGGLGFDILFGAQGDDLLVAAIGNSVANRADSRGSRMFGGQGDDTIIGSNRWDRMQGGPGDDLLYGFEGRDWIRGGPGADGIEGGAGVDDVQGGNGNDVIIVSRSDLVRGGSGRDYCQIEGEPTTLVSCGRNALEVAATAQPPVALEPAAPQPRPSGEDSGVKSISCSATVNLIDNIECEAVLKNTTKSTVRMTARVAFYDSSGVRIDSEGRVQSYVEPGESYIQVFYGPADTSRMEVLEVAMTAQRRTLRGAPVVQPYTDDLLLPIESAFVSAGPITPSVLADTSTVDIQFRNVSSLSGTLVGDVAFYNSAGIRLDHERRVERNVSPAEVVTIRYYTSDQAVSWRILEVEIDPT